MTINRKVSYDKTYTIKNSSPQSRDLILEHPITAGTTLAFPAEFAERTANLYRFSRTLGANGELSFRVSEESPVAERIVLSQLRTDILVSYASNQELSPQVRAALQRVAELKQRAQSDLEAQRNRLVAEQERIRRNLEAAGNQTQQGQEYLRRLSAADGEIDALDIRIEGARKNVQAAQKELEDHIAGLNL